MMTSKTVLFASLMASLALLMHVQGQPVFPSSHELTTPQRWKKNSSGAQEFRFDQQEQALRFDVLFDSKVDKWIYPLFPLRSSETLNGAVAITFDMKLVAHDGACKGCREGHFMAIGTADFKPSPADTWQTFRLDLTKLDLTKCTAFKLGLNPLNNNLSILMKNIHFEGTPKVPDLPPAIATVGPGTVFFNDAPLTFSCSRQLADLKYTVCDWHGTEVQSGVWPADGAANLTLSPLPIGYYTLKTTTSATEKAPVRTFAVIVNPNTRVYPKDSFFAIDTAQSWLAGQGAFECPWYDNDTYRLVSDLVAWAGFPHVRERLSAGISKSSKEYDYDKYMVNANLLKQRNITISGMFHDAPGWSDKITKLPRNLVAMYDFSKQVAHDFGDRMGDWEFWNEQDIGFAPESVWDYTAAMKAACLGFKAGNPETIVMPGALCAGVLTSYHHAMYLNDAAKYTDVLNYHTYAPPASYAGIHADIRTFLEKHNLAGREVWITECGTHQEGYSDKPGVMKQYMAHSPEQEMLHAEFYPKSQLYHAMQGLTRNYFFVFPPYNEGNGCKDWGTMRRDGSVKPIYTAMSAMTALLINARMLGEITLGDSIKAFLLEQPDATQVLVFWQKSRFDSAPEPKAPEAITVALSNGTYALQDMMGTPSSVTVTDGKAHLTATRYPSYLTGFKGLNPTIKAFPKGSVQRYTPRADEDLSVIVRVDLNNEDFAVTGMKSIAEMPKDQGRLKLQIWNLEDAPKTGSLTVKGGTFAGLPDTVSLPPRGKAEFDVVFSPVYNGDFQSQLIINGTFNGKAISNFVMPIQLLSLFLKHCQAQDMDWLKPECWRRNTSADGYEVRYDEQEKALRWDVSWSKVGDRWFYPVHELKLPAENLAKVKAIEFEVKTSQNKVENNFNCAFLMLVYDTETEKGRSVNLSYASPMNHWEIRRIMLDTQSLDLSAVKMIRLGANPAGTQMTYWLRNIRFLTSK